KRPEFSGFFRGTPENELAPTSLHTTTFYGYNLNGRIGALSITPAGRNQARESIRVTVYSRLDSESTYQEVDLIHGKQLKNSTGSSEDFPMSQKAVSDQLLGVGQTWQTVSRSLGTTYTNTSGRTIALSVIGFPNDSASERSTTVGILVNGTLRFSGGGYG